MYIQYAGDFTEAYNRLIVQKGKENYYGQKYSVGAVVEQAKKGLEILVLTTKLKQSKKELQERLTATGVMASSRKYYKTIFNMIKEFSPDHVILRMPDVRILRFLRKKKIPTLPVFADSFEMPMGLKGRLMYKILSLELRKSNINYVANHQINAAKSLESLGVNSSKILPYDWEHEFDPSSWMPHISSDLSKKEIQIFYAGSITESKGVFDLIKSLRVVQKKGRNVHLKIAGAGKIELAKKIAKSEQVLQQVEFLGCVDHDVVLSEMNLADVVVVPSRHSYPEGLPMTIMESLMVQTPVIISDHPMFVGRLKSGSAVEFFHETDFKELAEKIIMICSDVDEYNKRCKYTIIEWHKLNLELKWADMINRWINNPGDPYLAEHTLDKITIDET